MSEKWARLETEKKNWFEKSKKDIFIDISFQILTYWDFLEYNIAEIVSWTSNMHINLGIDN